MFAREVEGRIGMAAWSQLLRDQTSCPRDFPQTPTQGQSWASSLICSWEAYRDQMLMGHRVEKKKVSSKKE